MKFALLIHTGMGVVAYEAGTDPEAATALLRATEEVVAPSPVSIVVLHAKREVPEVSRGRCPFPDCPNPSISDDYPVALLRRELSSGWVIMPGARKGGGINAVEIPEYTGRVAHSACVDRVKRGLVGQASLL